MVLQVLCLAGDTGQGFLNWIKFLIGADFSIPHIKIYFPTAPLRPYTPLQGEVCMILGSIEIFENGLEAYTET